MANHPRTTSSPSPSLSSSSLLKRPWALPFLLSLSLLVFAFLFLHLHRPPSARLLRSSLFAVSRSRLRLTAIAGDPDSEANLVRFSAARGYPTPIAKDDRGWLVNPLALALQAGVLGGALECTSVHVGQIQPGTIRGNHRHHTCNETFVIWGSKTKFRLENANVKDKGYSEVTIGSDEVAIAASPSGTAHALINVDSRPTFFLGCQDSIITNSSTSDYKVWKDL